MKDILFDLVDIMPEMKRRRSSRSRSSSGGFFGAIGNFFRSISMVFLFGIVVIVALVLMPFILVRNRRNQSNDVFINQNDTAQNTPVNQNYNYASSKDSESKVSLKK